jgi:hypothetical protein
MFTTPHQYTFDWARAIARNSEALRPIIAALFTMLGEVTVERIPHSFHRAVLRILRPAESAVRRLVVIAARGLVVKPVASRPMPAQPITRGGGCRPRFRLFDPPKSLALYREATSPRILPRIHVFCADPRVAALWAASPPRKAAAVQDGLVNAGPLVRRLHALKSALDNLPRQARRLARWRAARQGVPHLKYKSPLRIGRPPGHRKNKTHEVDEILAECHALARDVLRADTS